MTRLSVSSDERLSNDKCKLVTTTAAPRYRGVNQEYPKRVWRARIYYKGRHVTLGRYKSSELAAKAHDAAACFVFGARAVTNFRYGDVSGSLPFGVNVKTKLQALRQNVARSVIRNTKHNAFFWRAEAAAVAFALGPECNRSYPMDAVWLECAFKATIAVAVRLGT